MFSSWWEGHNTWYLRSHPVTNISIHHSIIVPVSEIIPSVSPLSIYLYVLRDLHHSISVTIEYHRLSEPPPPPHSIYIYTYREIYTIPLLCLNQRSYPQLHTPIPSLSSILLKDIDLQNNFHILAVNFMSNATIFKMLSKWIQ